MLVPQTVNILLSFSWIYKNLFTIKEHCGKNAKHQVLYNKSSQFKKKHANTTSLQNVYKSLNNVMGIGLETSKFTNQGWGCSFSDILLAQQDVAMGLVPSTTKKEKEVMGSLLNYPYFYLIGTCLIINNIGIDCNNLFMHITHFFKHSYIIIFLQPQKQSVDACLKITYIVLANN